jgi:hypothetical protein
MCFYEGTNFCVTKTLFRCLSVKYVHHIVQILIYNVINVTRSIIMELRADNELKHVVVKFISLHLFIRSS